jgi:predicted transcriptional regulator
MNEPNHSECLEYKQSAKYSDEILKKIIRESFSINDLMDVPKDKRNKLIKDIHQNTGVSIRQLARVLGVGKNIIERALK